jgi:hypothetical protein
MGAQPIACPTMLERSDAMKRFLAIYIGTEAAPPIVRVSSISAAKNRSQAISAIMH